MTADDATATYTHPLRDTFTRLILPALRAFAEATVATSSGIPQRTINGLRSGRKPERGTLCQLIPALAELCIQNAPNIDDSDRLGVLAAWRDLQPTLRVCPTCGATLAGGRMYCRAACRQAAYRRRLTRRLDS